MKIAFFDTKSYDVESFNLANQELKFNLKFIDSRLTEDTAILAKGCDVVCAFVNDEVNKNTIEKLHEQNIGLIALRCAGYNNVDFEAAFGKVHVARVPAYSPYAVAEHAIALMMTLNRKTHKAYNRTKESDFRISGLTGMDFHGKTIGVIGTGKIGRVFIDICLGLGMKVLAYDLFPATIEKVEYVTLDEIYKNADVISLHCPLSKETTHMIDEAAVSKMKNGVMLINTSRGALIDSSALINGLKARKIGSAGLDVYEEESEYFFEDHSTQILDDDVLARLLSFTNVLITSHQAFLTFEALSNIAQTTLKSILDYQTGTKLENEICYQCTTTSQCPRNKNGKCF